MLHVSKVVTFYWQKTSAGVSLRSSPRLFASTADSEIQVSVSCWIIHGWGRSHSFLLYPGVQGQSGEPSESETQPDPLLDGELKIAGLSAGSRRFLSALWLKIRLVYIVGCPWCSCDRQRCHGDGYFNGCLFWGSSVFPRGWWFRSCRTLRKSLNLQKRLFIRVVSVQWAHKGDFTFTTMWQKSEKIHPSERFRPCLMLTNTKLCITYHIKE